MAENTQPCKKRRRNADERRQLLESAVDVEIIDALRVHCTLCNKTLHRSDRWDGHCGSFKHRALVYARDDPSLAQRAGFTDSSLKNKQSISHLQTQEERLQYLRSDPSVEVLAQPFRVKCLPCGREVTLPGYRLDGWNTHFTGDRHGYHAVIWYAENKPDASTPSGSIPSTSALGDRVSSLVPQGARSSTMPALFDMGRLNGSIVNGDEVLMDVGAGGLSHTSASTPILTLAPLLPHDMSSGVKDSPALTLLPPPRDENGCTIPGLGHNSRDRRKFFRQHKHARIIDSNNIFCTLCSRKIHSNAATYDPATWRGHCESLMHEANLARYGNASCSVDEPSSSATAPRIPLEGEEGRRAQFESHPHISEVQEYGVFCLPCQATVHLDRGQKYDHSKWKAHALRTRHRDRATIYDAKKKKNPVYSPGAVGDDRVSSSVSQTHRSISSGATNLSSPTSPLGFVPLPPGVKDNGMLRDQNTALRRELERLQAEVHMATGSGVEDYFARPSKKLSPEAAPESSKTLEELTTADDIELVDAEYVRCILCDVTLRSHPTYIWDVHCYSLKHRALVYARDDPSLAQRVGCTDVSLTILVLERQSTLQGQDQRLEYLRGNPLIQVLPEEFYVKCKPCGQEVKLDGYRMKGWTKHIKTHHHRYQTVIWYAENKRNGSTASGSIPSTSALSDSVCSVVPPSVQSCTPSGVCGSGEEEGTCETWNSGIVTLAPPYAQYFARNPALDLRSPLNSGTGSLSNSTTSPKLNLGAPGSSALGLSELFVPQILGSSSSVANPVGLDGAVVDWEDDVSPLAVPCDVADVKTSNGTGQEIVIDSESTLCKKRKRDDDGERKSKVSRSEGTQDKSPELPESSGEVGLKERALAYARNDPSLAQRAGCTDASLTTLVPQRQSTLKGKDKRLEYLRGNPLIQVLPEEFYVKCKPCGQEVELDEYRTPSWSRHIKTHSHRYQTVIWYAENKRNGSTASGSIPSTSALSDSVCSVGTQDKSPELPESSGEVGLKERALAYARNDPSLAQRAGFTDASLTTAVRPAPRKILVQEADRLKRFQGDPLLKVLETPFELQCRPCGRVFKLPGWIWQERTMHFNTDIHRYKTIIWCAENEPDLSEPALGEGGGAVEHVDNDEVSGLVTQHASTMPGVFDLYKLNGGSGEPVIDVDDTELSLSNSPTYSSILSLPSCGSQKIKSEMPSFSLGDDAMSPLVSHTLDSPTGSRVFDLVRPGAAEVYSTISTPVSCSTSDSWSPSGVLDLRGVDGRTRQRISMGFDAPSLPNKSTSFSQPPDLAGMFRQFTRTFATEVEQLEAEVHAVSGLHVDQYIAYAQLPS
ncbi:hypothetical protein FB45DRAFT_869517 [Roridomyces roridus]|uniref:Uncharacterized protein n=1 Tax=Roridomyces roridus TaxID=1738132 RepID=A0AAD7FK48_9AGAR|nr:hypothetical protein FB45DRAFT_869517 [Roridomyces roridus]